MVADDAKMVLREIKRDSKCNGHAIHVAIRSDSSNACSCFSKEYSFVDWRICFMRIDICFVLCTFGPLQMDRAVFALVKRQTKLTG